ncbi:hypothetical protein ACFW04_013945 [Cataglyphis niger]
MIVTHSIPGLSVEGNKIHFHDGVIIGWHFKCKCQFIRKSWASITLHLFARTHEIINQPHYIVLTDNNKMCYAPQCYVMICTSKRIQNAEIGQYFSSFEGTHYIPNEKLTKVYPYDMDAISIINNHYYH